VVSQNWTDTLRRNSIAPTGKKMVTKQYLPRKCPAEPGERTRARILRGPDITAGRGQLEICIPTASLTADLRRLILATMLPHPVVFTPDFTPG